MTTRKVKSPTKEFELTPERKVQLVINTSNGATIQAVGVKLEDVVPVAKEDGTVDESPNGYIKYQFKTDNPALKGFTMVYECGWYMDWEESAEFTIKALKSSDEWK